MKYYVRPTVDGENFTAGKLYEIQHCFGTGRVIVLNDAKEEIIVRCDGVVSARLDWRGKFERVNIPDEGEALTYSIGAARYNANIYVNRGEGWRINKGGEVLTSENFVPSSMMYNHNGKQVDVKEVCETLDELREILRAPEGEDIRTHAKVARVLADGLISLQK